MTSLLRLCALLLAGLAATPDRAVAQGLFAPAAQVGDRVVTAFEVDQRARMLQLFRAPGDPREEALTALVDERLQLAEAARMGLTVPDEELTEGMEEFAGRANLDRAQFVSTLSEAGIDVATFEDFVRAGILWRQVVRTRFGDRADISADEIEREVTGKPPADLRFLLSEIILPANNPEAAAEAEARAPQITAIDTFPAFADAARRYSASPSRDQGGTLDWLEAANLPPPIRAAVAGLSPGDVAGPIPLPNALAFFQLRDREEVASEGEVETLDYAAFYLPGGRGPGTLAEAARIRARVQSCDDLYSVAEGLPPGRLQRETLPPAQVPADVALELAKLDRGEVSTALTRAGGETLVVLMLCERSYADPEAEIDREAIRRELVNRRVSRLAENYLAELRANATIVTE